MKITQPSRIAFWRFIFIVTALISFLATYQLLGKAKTLGVDLSASRSWMGLIGGFSLMGLFWTLLFISTLRPFSGQAWSRYGEWFLALAESPERAPKWMHWLGVLLVGLALPGFTVAVMFPFIQSFLGGLDWMRFCSSGSLV